MSTYTTGEIAKLAGVTVRTVQYYDSRGILIPSDFSEGGRRLYTDDDLKRLRVICFLRELGIQINSIADILSAPNAEHVISLLLEQQLLLLQNEIAEREQQRDTIHALQRELKTLNNFSIENLGDIAHIMKNRKQLRRLRVSVLIAGMLMDAAEIGTLVLGITTGIWLPFGIALGLCILMGISIAFAYFQRVAYICPECHEVFRPKFWEYFWAKHTPKTRKLTCTTCGCLGYCVETYQTEMRREEAYADH